MKFNKPSNLTNKDACQGLSEWLEKNHPEGFHEHFNTHGCKYLGHYITMNEETLIVHDLYAYEGTKFTGKQFIAVYGDKNSEYSSKAESLLLPMEINS